MQVSQSEAISPLHPVAEIIHRRKREGSLPLERKDDVVLGLAIEGGGMRGVVCGGMVAALEELGLLNCFDVVFGSSAGAISGAYFIAGQARYGVTIFYENINNNSFINPWRLLWGRPIMSLEFLLDHVCIYEKPLDVEAVLASRIPLRPVAASTSTLKPIAFSELSNAVDLYTALRGSARIPVAAGAPVSFRGDHYLDASVVESIPYRSALRSGCTHVLALLTRPSGVKRKEPSWIERSLVAPRLRKYHPELPERYLRRADEYDAELRELEAASKFDASQPILSVQIPAGGPTVGTTEKDRTSLVTGAMAGFSAVYRTLGSKSPDLVEIITPTARVSPSFITGS